MSFCLVCYHKQNKLFPNFCLGNFVIKFELFVKLNPFTNTSSSPPQHLHTGCSTHHLSHLTGMDYSSNTNKNLMSNSCVKMQTFYQNILHFTVHFKQKLHFVINAQLILKCRGQRSPV